MCKSYCGIYIIALHLGLTLGTDVTYESKYKQLTVIPTDITNDTTKVTLSHNEIATIRSGVFYTLSLVYFLDLSNNLLETLEVKSFKGLTSLKYLLLTDNHFKVIPDLQILSSSLQHLYMDRNQIQHVSTTSLTNLPKLWTAKLSWNNITGDVQMSDSNIHYLDLGYNQIKHLDVSGMVKLKTLYIMGNKDLDSPNLSNTLQQLDMSNMSLTQLHNTLLEGLSSLQYIYLRLNQLTGPLHFPRLDNLKTLHLSYNKLTHTPNISHLHQLTNLFMSHNPITTVDIIFPATLQRLKLNDANIDYFSPVAFSRCISNIEYIYLRKSQLTNVPYIGTVASAFMLLDVSMNNIHTIDRMGEVGVTQGTIVVSSNPIMCDRRLCWTKREALSYDLQLTCHSPRNLQGIQLSDIVLYNLTCPGKIPLLLC